MKKRMPVRKNQARRKKGKFPFSKKAFRFFKKEGGKKDVKKREDPFSPEKLPKIFGRGLKKRIFSEGIPPALLIERLKGGNIPIFGCKIKGNGTEITVLERDYEKTFAILQRIWYNMGKGGEKANRGKPVSAVRTSGWLRPLYLCYRRIGAAAGAVCFFLLCVCTSPVVLSVSYRGSAAYRREEFAATLADCGVSVGAFVSEADLSFAEKELLSAFPALHFVSVQKRGFFVTVTAETSYFSPTAKKTDRLFSDRAGTVVSLKVLQGKAVVSVGESVKAGDLLVVGSSENGAPASDVMAHVVLCCAYREERFYKAENPALLELYKRNAQEACGAERVEEDVSRIEREADGFRYIVEFTYEYLVRGGF